MLSRLSTSILSLYDNGTTGFASTSFLFKSVFRVKQQLYNKWKEGKRKRLEGKRKKDIEGGREKEKGVFP